MCNTAIQVGVWPAPTCLGCLSTSLSSGTWTSSHMGLSYCSNNPIAPDPIHSFNSYLKTCSPTWFFILSPFVSSPMGLIFFTYLLLMCAASSLCAAVGSAKNVSNRSSSCKQGFRISKTVISVTSVNISFFSFPFFFSSSSLLIVGGLVDH